jgi:hypothetical protein
VGEGFGNKCHKPMISEHILEAHRKKKNAVKDSVKGIVTRV